MFVRILRLRQDGRRIPDHEIGRPEHQAVGDLQSTGREFELHQPLVNAGSGYSLHDAHVEAVQPGAGGMIIRGYDEYRGGAVLQEWEVTPLDQVVGDDGLKHWNWAR